MRYLNFESLSVRKEIPEFPKRFLSRIQSR